MSARSTSSRRRAKNSERASQSRTPGLAPNNTYWQVSRRPLQILIFLLPLILLYEMAMISILRVGDVQHYNLAHGSLVRFFDVFGMERAGWYLPGIALLVVLLVWQGLAREPWRIEWRALPIMLGESLVLACPVVVLGAVAMQLGAEGVAAMSATSAPSGLLARIAGSIGAGIYEELVFRMLVIGVAHTLLVDVAEMGRRSGTAAAIGISAILFMLYHWIGRDPGLIPLGQHAFYLLAGVYFGLVFVIRGFGIVVGVHALYDVLAAFFLGGGST